MNSKWKKGHKEHLAFYNKDTKITELTRPYRLYAVKAEKLQGQRRDTT